MLARPDAVPRVIHEMPNLVHYPIKIRAGFGTVLCHRRTRTDGRGRSSVLRVLHLVAAPSAPRRRGHSFKYPSIFFAMNQSSLGQDILHSSPPKRRRGGHGGGQQPFPFPAAAAADIIRFSDSLGLFFHGGVVNGHSCHSHSFTPVSSRKRHEAASGHN